MPSAESKVKHQFKNAERSKLVRLYSIAVKLDAAFEEFIKEPDLFAYGWLRDSMKEYRELVNEINSETED